MKVAPKVAVLIGWAAGAWLGMANIAAFPKEVLRFDSKFFEGLHWRAIGPFRGGRTLAVTGVLGQPEVYYFGAVGGGVWRTIDAGRTWNPIFDSQPIASIGAIAVAPANTQVIYVGTGEADMRSDIAYGNGMYKSEDAGQTWTPLGLGDSRQIAQILVDPHDANKIFVAALGHAYGPNAERGVFRSLDGGKTWQRVLFRDENTGAIDLAFEPGNSATIYAALWQTRRPPWNIYPPSNGPGSGLYRSKDGGDHWEQLAGHGLPSQGLGRMGIAFAPSNPKRMYLIADAKDGGLFRSDDGGENWEHVSNDKRIWGRGWYFGQVSVHPTDADTVYLPNTALYRSRDGGRTFTVIKGAPGGDDYHALWIDPAEPKRMILSSDQGTVVTRNGGETWSSWYNQPTGQFYHVATDHRFPYWVYGAQQDSGAAATASRSRYRSLNFHDWRPMNAGDENGYVAPDPLNSEVLYGGFVTRQNLQNEQAVQMPPGLAHAEEQRRTWTLPLIFAPTNPYVLYFGTQMLFRTTDGGNSWQTISPDLTREDPGIPENLDAATVADAPKGKRRGVIYTIGPSYVRTGEIWVGTDDGLIQLTQDEGKTWTNVTPPELTPWSKVTHIEASHSDAGTAYAAVDRHRLEDLRAYLYRTRNFGKTWELASRGIPDGDFLNCVREDPVRKGLLYACSERGVFVSFDEGDEWSPLQLNLPTTSVRDLVVHENDLVIATHGRSFWVLDNVTPLRQMSGEVSSADAWLFKPAVAYRVQHGSDQGTPVPFDEPLASNPPNGAVLDYYLKSKPSGPVQLEITDSSGKLVRRFASDDPLPRMDPDPLPIMTQWVPSPIPLSTEAGVHRFVWDLHYPLPKTVRPRLGGPLGPWALPGIYEAKLTVDGKSMSQRLTIKMDPGVKTSQPALIRQFDTANKLAGELGALSSAVRQAEDLQKQIHQREKEASSYPELANALEEAQQKLSALAGSENAAEFGFLVLTLPGSSGVTLWRATSVVTRLLLLVESADAPPSTDTHMAVDRWAAAAEEVLGRWNALQTEERGRINPMLQRAGLQPFSK